MTGGDTLVILELDRAFRSAKDALTELDKLTERGIAIQIVSMQIDTATPHGKLLYTFISGLAEFERHLLSQRTKQGLKAARRRGKRLGRPAKMTPSQIRIAKSEIEQPDMTIAQVAAKYEVHPWTLTRSIRRLLVLSGVPPDITLPISPSLTSRQSCPSNSGKRRLPVRRACMSARFWVRAVVSSASVVSIARSHVDRISAIFRCSESGGKVRATLSNPFAQAFCSGPHLPAMRSPASIFRAAS